LVRDAGYQRAKGFSLSMTCPVLASNSNDGPALAETMANTKSPMVAMPRERIRRMWNRLMSPPPLRCVAENGNLPERSNRPRFQTRNVFPCYLAYVTPRWQ